MVDCVMLSEPLAAFVGVVGGHRLPYTALLEAVDARIRSLGLPTQFRGGANRELAALLGISPQDAYDLSRREWLRVHSWPVSKLNNRIHP
jgi:hypothetical protein